MSFPPSELDEDVIRRFIALVFNHEDPDVFCGFIIITLQHADHRLGTTSWGVDEQAAAAMALQASIRYAERAKLTDKVKDTWKEWFKINGTQDKAEANNIPEIDGELRVAQYELEENTGDEEARFEAIIERFIEAKLRREGKIA